MRLYKIVLIAFIGLVLLAVAAVAALMFVDPSIFRNQLETMASAALSRDFQINGPIRIEKSLRPRIIVEDITIGNPGWAADPHFATAKKVGLQVALFPLLLGDLNVLDVAFSGVKLFIEEGPEGDNNYSFGDDGDSEAAGVLPPIEQLMVADTVINFRSVDGRSRRFEIGEARLWNTPGEPERIEARGTTKGMTFTILLAADSPAELSGPQNPWSLKLDIEGPDMSLALAGQMEQAFKWERGDYQIKIRGDQADSLETLLEVAFPTSGPFELSANVNKTGGAFRVTDIYARVEGLPELPAIELSDGEASGGRNEPLRLALEGLFDNLPFALEFASTQPFEGISQSTPWPIEVRLNLAEIKLNLDGAIIPATLAEGFELDASVQGETSDTLARLLGTDLPEVGPYRFSFHTQIAEGSIKVTELKGSIEQPGLWQTLAVEQGNVTVKEKGSVAASLNVVLDKAPLSLTFEGGPKATEGAGKKAWPLKIQASATGATIRGEGAVVATENGKLLQIATRISGNRFESLGPLIGASLPALGKFDLRADVSTDGDVHAARNLQVQIKNNRFSGSARWEDKAPRPLLTGKLSTGQLTLSELKDPSKPSPKSRTTGLLDRPLRLDGLTAFDARLDLNVKNVKGSPIAVTDINSTVTLADGKLKAPFRANLAGAPVKGQLQVRRQKNVPAVALKATAGKIDVGQTLKQLKLPDMVSGTADAINLDSNSSGKTLRALLWQPAFSLQIKPADLNATLEIINQTLDFQIDGAVISANKDQPLAGAFNGRIGGAPFKAEISTSNLNQIRKADAPFPMQAKIQTDDVQFTAQGSIARPFAKNEFDFSYELTGTEIERLDPLADFVVPLRGEFRARGHITARNNRFTYKEDLRIGKSDLKADITVLRNPPRPKITGRIFSSQIHVDDVEFFNVDKEASPDQDNSRVIPDYALPVEVLFSADADIDIKAEQIRTQLGDLGEFVSKIRLKDGRLNYSISVAGATGGSLNSEFDLNAAVDPPLKKMQLNAKDLNLGFFLRSIGVNDYVEGNVDLIVDLAGSGATRYTFLENAEGRITLIGGPGQIPGRRIDLWAADLIPTMLSTNWQREDVTETNCFVAHIEVKEGQAEIEDLLLDTQRITIAASGLLNLGTEELDIIIAPRPKRASLVSLANPVRIEGTLAEPEVSVTRIPRGRRLAGAGLLAGLVNPAFLIFALSDTGTGEANPCDAAVERARDAAGIDTE
ncbi:MAG: AsmA family protein [Desulfobacterales bacterium]|jgi:uncharacterized protein involved in outer membrane biogenesis